MQNLTFALFDADPFAKILVHAATLKISRMNRVAQLMLAPDANGLAVHEVNEFLPMEFWKKLIEKSKVTPEWDGPNVNGIKWKFPRSNGIDVSGTIYLSPVKDVHGNTEQFLVSILDDNVYQHRNTSAELDLRLTEEGKTLRQFLDAVPTQIWSAKPDGTLDFINEFTNDYVGRDITKRLQAGSWANGIHVDDLAVVVETWTASLNTGIPLENRCRVFRESDQSFRWHISRAIPIYDANGRIERWAGHTSDIQSLVDTEERLMEAKTHAEDYAHKFDVVFDESPAAMCFQAGPDHVFEKVNDQFRNLILGRELLGKPLLEALPELCDQDLPRLMNDVFRSGVPFIGRGHALSLFNAETQAPETVYIDFSLQRINDTSGEPYGIFTYAYLVTDRVMGENSLKESKEALRKAKDQAESANELKSAFLANMSHEIRTPMTAVLGFTELLRRFDLTPEIRDATMARIDNCGRLLLRIIDDVLDVSKVEAGKLVVQKVHFSPDEVAREVIDVMRLTADQKAIPLRLIVEESIPQLVYSDPSRVRQILINLIGNAIKFTYSGEVVVTIRGQLESETLIMEVCDTGIGISEENQKHLFKPFMQADSSITRQFGGTGLGLHLSRRLAEQLDGTLELKSCGVNRGSCFALSVKGGPFDTLKSAELSKVAKEEVSHFGNRLLNHHVLVAEDAPDTQTILRMFLEGEGAVVMIVGNGKEAIAEALSVFPDVVLMDIQMPILDGLEATRQLRSLGFSTPIIALTAHVMDEEQRRCIEAGCDDHLAKPIQQNQLVEKILFHLARFKK